MPLEALKAFLCYKHFLLRRIFQARSLILRLKSKQMFSKPSSYNALKAGPPGTETQQRLYST